MSLLRLDHDILNFLSKYQHLIYNLKLILGLNQKFIFIHFTRFKHAGTNDTNVIIAAFVTCYARLKLLDLLEAAGENVIYYDTDSLILVTRPD